MDKFLPSQVLQQADKVAANHPTVDSIICCAQCESKGFKPYKYGTLNRSHVGNNVYTNQLNITDTSDTCPQCNAPRELRRY